MSVEQAPVDEGTKDTVRELVSMCNNLQSNQKEMQEQLEGQSEQIENLQQENQAQKALIEAYQKKLGRIDDLLVGEERDLAEDEFDVADDIWTQIQEAKSLSEESLSVAQTSSVRDSTTSKKEIAKKLSRNETVIKSINTSQKGAAVDCPKVIDMGKPDTRLAHRSILDGWNELCDEWECFEIIKKDGSKMLRCSTESLSGVIVRAVKNDLSDPEVTETLNSWLASEGVR